MTCCLSRCTAVVCSAPGILRVRHGHMVNLPGNVWSTKPWISVRKKKKYKKGTQGLKLDTIKPDYRLTRFKQEDPKMEAYAYQLTAYSRVKSSDPIEAVCKLTRTAPPVAWSHVHQSTHIDQEYLDKFISHVEDSCDTFNSLYRHKGLPTNFDSFTPIQLDAFCQQYAAAFLQNLLNFLYTDSQSGELILKNSHTSFNKNTGAFWRIDLDKYENSTRIVSKFQFRNFVDIMLRTTQPISYRALVGQTAHGTLLDECLPGLCASKMQIFKEVRPIEQYPGFISETLYPYNHTLFKVVSSVLSDREMQYAAMMTGFGQTVATTQHRLGYPCHVDLLPAVEQPEAVNVVVTDGNRYCLAVYQCNTTNTCGIQLDAGHLNMCALSPVQQLVARGRVNEALAGDLLALLTTDTHEVGAFQLPTIEERRKRGFSWEEGGNC